jgi:hypothetical protein
MKREEDELEEIGIEEDLGRELIEEMIEAE